MNTYLPSLASIQEGNVILPILILCFLTFHTPIYLAHQANKRNSSPPSSAVAFFLSFLPSPVGGILYVHGLFGAIPCLAAILWLMSQSSGIETDRLIFGNSVVIMAVSSSCSAALMRRSMKRSVKEKTILSE
jgi:hypothetical protein